MQSPAAILAQGVAGGEAREQISQEWPLDDGAADIVFKGDDITGGVDRRTSAAALRVLPVFGSRNSRRGFDRCRILLWPTANTAVKDPSAALQSPVAER